MNDRPATCGFDALAEAARLETARVYGTLCPEQSQADRDARRAAEWEQWRTEQHPPTRHLRVIHSRLADERRVQLEQAIARGCTDIQAAAEQGVTVATVAQVRADLEALSA